MKKKNLIISLIILLIIILIGFLLFNDNTRVYKQTINETYKVLNKTLTKYQNIPGFLNKDNNLSLDISNINSPEESLSLNFQLSPTNENIYLDLKFPSSNYTYLYTNHSSYLRKDNAFKTFDYTIKECDEEECPSESLNTIIANSLGTNNVKYETLSTLLKDLKKTINTSFSQNFITKKTITTGSSKETKYSYLLNKNSLGVLVSKIEHNKTLKDSLFNTFGSILSIYDITKDNFKDVLSNSDIAGTFNIYKTKNKITKIEISLQDTFNLTIDLTSNINIYYKSATFNMKSTIGSTTTNITLYSTNSRYLELNITPNTVNTNIDYNIYNGVTKSSGSLQWTKDDITLTNDKLDLKITYKLDNNLSIPSEVTNTNLSNEEFEDYLDNLEQSISNSTILKNLIDYIKDLGLNDLL